ncbi:hypothetical protein [Plantactinospora sp. KLBMP9567]|uniref:hypothetical protein n=1 Tax=Plantactinospora sp. KLBMP9567 TaxID=3085900 RepID=UPI002981399B|nr:hypothetical protein [Plantactinospora sp. KLBMP9567]MDW5325010.1 hypothetical protein [Plantactinospora sp. KLBMP9567]
MTVHESAGGFAGDPAAALDVAGSTGCCGSPAQATNVTLPDPAGGTCCGTPAEAVAANSCCAPVARAEAVAAGQGCCG